MNRKESADHIPLPKSVRCSLVVEQESFDYLTGGACYTVTRDTGGRSGKTRWQNCTQADVESIQKAFMEDMRRIAAMTAAKYRRAA